MTTLTKQVTESASGGFGLGKIEGKRRWSVRIIAAGAGSSGVHTAEALKTTGASAWPIGTKVNIDHQSWEERYDQPAGSLKSLAGAIVTTPVWQEEPVPGLYAEIEVSEQWGPFVEQFADIIGLSITAGYWGDEVNEVGLPIVEGYIPSPLNTVDLVTVPGANGRILSALESYGIIVHDTEPKGKKPMTEEERAALVADLIEALTPVLQPVVEEPAEEDAVEVLSGAEIAELVLEADLPAVARKRAFASIDALEHATAELVEAAIKAESELVEALKEEMPVSRLKESKSITAKDLLVEGWN